MITYAFVFGEMSILGTSFMLAGEAAPKDIADRLIGAEERISHDAARRFVSYGSSKARRASARLSYIKTAQGFAGASGVLRSGSGGYTTVGQTLPRSRSRPRRQYTDVQLRRALIPARDAGMTAAKKSVVDGVFDSLRQNGFN